jgi:hypothetical protein
MAFTIIVVLLALGVGSTGLATAVDHVDATPRSAPAAVGVELAAETAALQAAFGLACAADASHEPATDTYVPRIGVRAGPCTLGDITLQRGVTDSSGAAEVLAQAMDNTPDQAQPGLEQAWEAVTTAAAHEHAADPATGEAPAAAPAQVTAPPVAAPPVTAPPVDPGPPVDAPAGPPSDVPGGRP